MATDSDAGRTKRPRRPSLICRNLRAGRPAHRRRQSQPAVNHSPPAGDHTAAPRSGPGPERDRTRTRAGPDTDQSGTGTGPERDRTRTRAGSEPDQSGTGPGPERDRTRTRAGSGTDQSGIGHGPERDRTRTRAGSDSDQSGTGLGPERDRTRTRVGPDSDQSGIGPGPERDRNRTRAGPGPGPERDQTRTRAGPYTDQCGTGPFPRLDRTCRIGTRSGAKPDQIRTRADQRERRPYQSSTGPERAGPRTGPDRAGPDRTGAGCEISGVISVRHRQCAQEIPSVLAARRRPVTCHLSPVTILSEPGPNECRPPSSVRPVQPALRNETDVALRAPQERGNNVARWRS